MNIKTKLKNSPLFPLLIYLRYFVKRYIIRREIRSFKFAKGIKLEAVDKGITFFGYYNISPSNSNGDILYLKVTKEIVRGSLVEPASIMLKHANGTISKITETKAWNWQQGCMLQWHPGKDDQLLFNDYDQDKDQYISKVINTSGKIIKTYPIPVNNVSKCGTYALSLNYDRLAKMRPDYGYFNRKDNELPGDDQDGIWHQDLNTGKTKLIITLEQLKILSPTATMHGAEHKVNHIDINPGGKRFIFLHRWIGPQGRFMRLISANPDGSDIRILNGDIMTSHCCWLNNNEILSFCEHKGESGYFKFIDANRPLVRELGFEKMPKVDGHPSISPDKHWVLTDTYPSKSRMSSLYLYDIRQNSLMHLGRFLQPLRYKKEMRIDLHPKWSLDGKHVFFESGHNSRRNLYCLTDILMDI